MNKLLCSNVLCFGETPRLTNGIRKQENLVTILSSINFTSGKVLNTPRGEGMVCLFVFWTVFTFFNMIFWILREVDQRGDIISLRNTLNLPISLL